ncbi:MAG: P-loop NTPase [Planctomycetaceae bacterium]|nr:P-loop NTPase [Planctomycetaceae bacterium]
MPDQASQLRRLVLRSGRPPAGDDAQPPRTLVVSGGKVGLGSTTLAVNLAVALASHGARTVLIDADLYRADVAAHCGLGESVTIADVLLARRDIHEALQRGPGGLQVIAGTRTSQARNACSDRALQRLLKQIQSLGKHADFVLIDTGNGPSEPTIRLWQSAQDVLFVTTPDAVAVMDTYATVKTLLSRSAIQSPLRLVVNRADSEEAAADVHRRIDHSCQRFLGLSLPLAGWLPSDAAALAALRRGQPIVLSRPESKLTLGIEQLAERLLAPESPARQPRLAA